MDDKGVKNYLREKVPINRDLDVTHNLYDETKGPEVYFVVDVELD